MVQDSNSLDSQVQLARSFLESEEAHSLGYSGRARKLSQVAEALLSRLDDLVQQEMSDTGKCAHVSRGDIEGCIGLWRSAAAHCDSFSSRAVFGGVHGLSGYEFFSPVGVVGIILPWNFPSIVLSERLPFVLAAGCSALIKTSEIAEGAVRSIVDLTREIWGTDAVATVMPRGGPELGQALCEHPGVDMISFTGGSETGRKVAQACAPSLKRMSLELGGKNSVVVHRDADCHRAAASIAEASLINAGQACVQGSRVIVHSSIYEEFLTALADAYGHHIEQHFHECGVGVQGLVGESHANKVQSFVLDAYERGVDRLDTFSKGGNSWSSPPFVFRDVKLDDRLFHDEVFGPVVTVSEYSDVTEAITLANQGSFGLAAYLWTSSISVAMELSQAIRAGRIWVNCDVRDSITQLSIGGLGESGFGRELGWEGIRTYSNMHSLVLR